MSDEPRTPRPVTDHALFTFRVWSLHAATHDNKSVINWFLVVGAALVLYALVIAQLGSPTPRSLTS